MPVTAKEPGDRESRLEDLRRDYFNTSKLGPDPIPHPVSQEFFEYYTESALDILFHAYGSDMRLKLNGLRTRAWTAATN